MIVNVRGANGSGKSTVVRQFMALGHQAPLYGVLGVRFPEAYVVRITALESTVYVLGPYHIPTGGCDSLLSSQVLVLLRRYSGRGHVLFEGSLVSDHWGEVGEFLDTQVPDVVLAFMSASMEDCLRRVATRRQERGTTEVMDPKNTEKRYKAVVRTRRNFIEGRHRTMTLSDDRGASEVLEVFRGSR